MRRAGYEVRVLVQEGLSWEENPPTLMEFTRRDLRWCQGNMQYWWLLALPGLKAGEPLPTDLRDPHVSRLSGLDGDDGPWRRFARAFRYAVGAAMCRSRSAGHCVVRNHDTDGACAQDGDMPLMCMLTAPARQSYGGAFTFVLNILGETVFMTLLTPILALSHTIFLTHLFVFRRGSSWTGQLRESHAVSWRLALRKILAADAGGLHHSGRCRDQVARRYRIGFVWQRPGSFWRYRSRSRTASPAIGTLFARIGIGRIPEESEPPSCCCH